jgi:HTH-type transcriptional regulator/antitoxin HigA
LLRGTTELTANIAEKLTVVLGGSVTFWLSREAQYRNDLRRREAFEGREWVRNLPVKDMIAFGWLGANPRHELKACLEFFGVPDVSTWQRTYADVLSNVALRTSATFTSNPAAVAAWLRFGELKSTKVPCASWDALAFRKVLGDARALTRKKKPSAFLRDLQELCASCGVAVVVARAPNGCRASGATRFIAPDKALLLLSFRYLSDDHFWFTFFHEAGHLLLHGPRMLFLEGVDLATNQEAEANAFAADLLIPPHAHAAFSQLRPELRAIATFARDIGISPGIVVGQLQHSGRLPRNHWNDLKVRFDWSTIDE